jgi:hypothetical protein
MVEADLEALQRGQTSRATEPASREDLVAARAAPSSRQ